MASKSRRGGIVYSNVIISSPVPQPLVQVTWASNPYNDHHCRLFVGTDTGDVWTFPSAMHTLNSIWGGQWTGPDARTLI